MILLFPCAGFLAVSANPPRPIITELRVEYPVPVNPSQFLALMIFDRSTISTEKFVLRDWKRN